MMSSFITEEGVMWQCNDCFYSSKVKTNVREHVESQHFDSTGIVCPHCDKIMPNKKSLRNHVYGVHKLKNK